MPTNRIVATPRSSSAPGRSRYSSPGIPINNFRKDNLDVLGDVFKDVLLLCRKAGLVKLGHVALDGSKIRATRPALAVNWTL